MRLRHSLRFRIIATFSIAGVLMGMIFTGIIFGFLHGAEDSIFENQLVFEGDRFLERYAQAKDTPLPYTSTMQGYLGLEGMPEPIERWVSDLKPGLYESALRDFHIYIARIDGSQELFYLVYQVEAIEPLETMAMIKMTFFGVLVVTLCSGLFGFIIANRMIDPVMRLSKMVAKSKPEDPSLPVEGQFYDDEVGQLARDFQTSLERVGAFLARERRFTRDASHEFRTPVTVIKGAAELLARQRKNSPDTRALGRIERAVRDLENIIETFLYLGREGSTTDPDECCSISSIVEEALEQNLYLLEGKVVEVKYENSPGFEIDAPRAVVAITIGNLIRNSFQYTEQGSVHLVLGTSNFQIKDTGRGIAKDDLDQITLREKRATSGKGFGLGLSIVNDFCERYGWHLEIQSELAKGTEVQLNFGPAPT